MHCATCQLRGQLLFCSPRRQAIGSCAELCLPHGRESLLRACYALGPGAALAWRGYLFQILTEAPSMPVMIKYVHDKRQLD